MSIPLTSWASGDRATLDRNTEAIIRRSTPSTGTWITPTLGNGFTLSTAAPQYRRSGSLVYLRGDVTGGTIGTAAFTLPVGYRPTRTMFFPATNTYGGYAEVTSAGDVLINNANNAGFDGIVFFID